MPFRRALEAALGALALFAAPAAAREPAADPRPELALMGTVPIYWGEAADIGELIGGTAQPHWARAVLERDWRLVPLDYLGEEALAGHAHLLLAQPRGLTPEENVALDQWVREGGRLLLFADPMMTGESRFGLGDRRRPQDVALLSPILVRWGLELQFDEAQERGLQTREIAGRPIPLNLPGRFAMTAGTAQCALEGAGVLARCTLGEGEIVILADAAMLDLVGAGRDAIEALDQLMGAAFGSDGETTGSSRSNAGDAGPPPKLSP